MRRGLLSLNGIGFCCIFVALRVVLVVTRLRICAYALSSFLLRFLAVLSHGVHVAGFAGELSGDARKRVELIRGAKKNVKRRRAKWKKFDGIAIALLLSAGCFSIARGGVFRAENFV